MRETPEAVYAESNRVEVLSAQVDAWCGRAAHSPRRRYRLCAHQPAESVHEMLICLDRSTYVRPHKHLGKSESIHVIEGRARLLLFDEDGRIFHQVPLGAYGTDRVFFHRMNEPVFHTLWLESGRFVFHETTQGPFLPEHTVFAEWAPVEGTPEVPVYLASLERALD